MGLDLTAACAILEEANRSGANANPAHAQMYVMGTLLRHGSEDQKEEYLPKMAAGELRLQAFGVTEPEAGTDTASISTFAERHGDRYVVSGRKIYISRVQPGAAERLGLGASRLRERHPRLVHCGISGYGEGGPYTKKKAYDLLVQCEAGLVSITGTEETPSKVGISVADIVAGMYAYSGILSALFRRERTGVGATLEVSMLEALGEWMGFPAFFAGYGGEEPKRSGASHAAIAPYGPFACADGQTVFLGIQNEREWGAFCAGVLERPEMAEEERFRTNTRRVENSEALHAEIDRVFSRLPSGEAIERLERAGVANARMRTVRQFLDHPQLEARDRWREFGSPAGPLRGLLPPATLEGAEPVMAPIPAVGEHTEGILLELGYDEAGISILRQNGVT
jgi:itaconate CoA-transferase